MAQPAAVALCLALFTPVAFEGMDPARFHSPIPFAWSENDPGAVSTLVVTSRTGVVPRGRCIVHARRAKDGSVTFDFRTEDSRGRDGVEYMVSTDFAPSEYPLREGAASDKTYAEGHLRIYDEAPNHGLRVWDVTIDRWLFHATGASITDYDEPDEKSAHESFSLTCEPGVG
jgi:hypothetical protein